MITPEKKVFKLSKLKPASYNPRQISKTALAGLSESLKKFGYLQPIIVNIHNKQPTIIGGHQRVKALEIQGIEEAECFVVDFDKLTEKAANIALNNQHISGEWSADLLQPLLEEMNSELPEFKVLAFDNLAEEFNFDFTSEEQKEKEDIIPDEPETVVIKLGDLIELGEHRLLCGDSTDRRAVEYLMGRKEPFLLVTDPPYGVEYDPNWRNEAAGKGLISYAASSIGKVQNDNRVDWFEAYKISKAKVCYVWHADRHAKQVQESIEKAGFEIVCQIIWAKPMFAIGRGDYHWQHEPCWYGVKKGVKHNWQGSRSDSTLWKIERGCKEKTGHATEKPLECMERPIRNNTSKGQLVYDSFLGSGTTLIACEKTNRKCYGMEIDPSYCQIIIQRWCDYTEKNQIKINGEGVSWDKFKGSF
jgi:DNA modification methylase